jgi:hypothetical protein
MQPNVRRGRTTATANIRSWAFTATAKTIASRSTWVSYPWDRVMLHRRMGCGEMAMNILYLQAPSIPILRRSCFSELSWRPLETIETSSSVRLEMMNLILVGAGMLTVTGAQYMTISGFSQGNEMLVDWDFSDILNTYTVVSTSYLV